MKINKKSYSIALASTVLFFVFSILISSLALAAQESRLSEDIGENGEPSIYGDKVVWAYWDKIHLYDLKTRNDTTIIIPEHYYAANSVIYDNKIVWHLCNSNDVEHSSKLCVYDILTSTSSLITENVSSYARPDIYGDRFVWVGMSHIYMYDISTQIQTQIPTNGFPSDPAIYDNKIVWVGSGDGTITDKNKNSIGRSDIYMYDLSTSKETRITTSGLASAPAIYGDRIVWQDKRNLDVLTSGIGDIYMYNLSTEKESRISYSGKPSSGSSPAIYGDRIVWQDHRNGKEDIYMYDLSTQKETQITTSGSAHDPDVYGDRIVYRDNRQRLPPGDGYFSDIYTYDLTARHTEPQTGFISNVTSGPAPITVLFTDTSTGGVPTSWYWDFGDGAYSGNAMNTTHTFTKPGVYNVTLTVANEAGNNTVTKPDYIIVTSPETLVADFNAGITTSGPAPLDMRFYDTSTGGVPTSWYWDFGDGIISKHAMNATHTFTKPGFYNVTLTVENEVSNSTVKKKSYTNVTSPINVTSSKKPVADFFADVVSGTAPLTVLFTDTSTGGAPTSWYWDTGDGAYSGHAMNTTHTFTNPGLYDITLTVANEAGNSTAIEKSYIKVSSPKTPVAYFSANVTSGTVPLTVLFAATRPQTLLYTEIIAGGVPTSWYWDFGDGINSKHAMNVTHTFTKSGNYTVSLTVENAAGKSTATKQGYIVVTNSSTPIADFNNKITEG